MEMQGFFMFKEMDKPYLQMVQNLFLQLQIMVMLTQAFISLRQTKLGLLLAVLKLCASTAVAISGLGQRPLVQS